MIFTRMMYDRLILFTLAIGLALSVGCGGGNNSAGNNDPGPIDNPGPSDEKFTFSVFGDLNGGGCEKNERVSRLVAMMDASDADFFIQTGDLGEGYGDITCFNTAPSGCELNTDQSGNMREKLLPLIDRTPPEGLNATFFPVVGNHDYNDDWYPDPCGDTFCDLLNLDTAGIYRDYVNHGDILQADGLSPHILNNGDICEDADAFRTDFYYSFDYKNSYFIVLNLNQDYYNMLSCHSTRVPDGYTGCQDYCSDESLFMDEDRLRTCYRVYHYDWLVSELQKAQAAAYAHIFVFAHAPLLTSGENHGPTLGASRIRALLEQYDVDIYFNGHNHAYERTHAVKGDGIDPKGTVYITTGTGGASADTSTGDWFTAKTYRDWSRYNELEKMASYLLITVDGDQVSGRTISLGVDTGPVDEFVLQKTNADATPPVVRNIFPSSVVSGTHTTMAFDTDENATCRYARSSGLEFDAMPNELSTTGQKFHATQLDGLSVIESPYRLFVKCQDGSGNRSDDFEITFNVTDTALAAFPGAQGWGADTAGGRGGRVIKVANLDDSGPGSLRAACEATGPRMVVFDVSGIIQLQSPITIEDPHITIAGESAPDGGITLYGSNGPGGMHTKWMSGNDPAVEVHDLIMRFIRVRGAVDDDQGDALRLFNVQNAIVDHCSLAWASDETADLNRSKDITIQWSIISDSINAGSDHNLGVLHNYGSSARFSMHHNLLAHHNYRFPVFGSDDVDVRNNVMYNWRDGCTWLAALDVGHTIAFPHDINIVGNYYKKGPNSRTFQGANRPIEISAQYNYYLSGNYYVSTDGFTTANQSEMLHPDGVSEWNDIGAELSGTPAIVTHNYSDAYDHVLNTSGAWPRDAIDARTVNDTRQGEGGWKTAYEPALLDQGLVFGAAGTDTDGDGMPDAWESLRGLDPGIADDRQDDDNDGYTNIEAYLHEKAAGLSDS